MASALQTSSGKGRGAKAKLKQSALDEAQQIAERIIARTATAKDYDRLDELGDEAHDHASREVTRLAAQRDQPAQTGTAVDTKKLAQGLALIVEAFGGLPAVPADQAKAQR
jgi:hypothetical protein